MDLRYEQGEEIARGGMGVVYEGRHRVTGRRVAIKRITQALSSDAEVVARFLREARAAAAIEHPNVVQILDCGVEDATPYIVMERLQGRPLSALLEDEGPLAPSRAVELLRPVLGALDRAHAVGVVHRDLKPENIFLCEIEGEAPTPKLLDFGIARYHEADDAERVLHRTRTGVVMGTPAYMSPEQAIGRRDLDPRTDVYSLGVILYEALSGRLPYEYDSYNALILAIVHEPPTPLAELAPTLAAPMVAVVERAMAQDLDERFPSVLALRDALDAAVSGADTQAIEAAATISRADAPALEASPAPRVVSRTAFAPTLGPTAPPREDERRVRWPMMLGVAGVLGLLGALLFVLIALPDEPTEGVTVPSTAPPPVAEPEAALPSGLEAPDVEPAPPPVATPPEPPPSDPAPARPASRRSRASATRQANAPAPAPRPTAPPAEPEEASPAPAAPPTVHHRAGDLDPTEFF